MLRDTLMNAKEAPDRFEMLRTSVRKEEMEAREKVTTKRSKADATQHSGSSAGSAQITQAIPKPKMPPDSLRRRIGKQDPWNNEDGSKPETVEEYDGAQAANKEQDTVPAEPTWTPAANEGMGRIPPPPPKYPPMGMAMDPTWNTQAQTQQRKSKAQSGHEQWGEQQARTKAVYVHQQRWVLGNEPRSSK